MSFTRPSVQTELDRFFKAISKSPDSFQSISKSAFTQARKKLKPEAFVELTKLNLAYFDQNAPFKKDWKQKRVVAIDGSLLNLPASDELKDDFGFITNQYEEIISARCSFAYDVCNELVLDAQLARRDSCEKDLALKHLEGLNPRTDILVLDRGYPCHWLIGLVMKRGYKFCIRLSTAWKDAVVLANSNEKDIDWTLKRRSNKDLGKIKEYDIPMQLAGLRLVCIDLPSGEKEVLATNLTNREEFTFDDLKRLYHMRWAVEEGYKSFKKVLHIEYFTGRTTNAIQQDFHAKVFMLNLASMIRTQGVKIKKQAKKKTCHKQQVNKTQAIAKTKDFFIDILYSSAIKPLIMKLLSILSKRTEVIRPDRSFPRKDVSRSRRHKNLNSKGI